MYVAQPTCARSGGVTAEITIWKSHCTLVVMAQHMVVRLAGNISLQMFHESGPRDMLNAKAKTYTIKMDTRPMTVMPFAVGDEVGVDIA